MSAYSKSSASKLATASTGLQTVFRRVLQFFDHTILTGFRDETAQDMAYDLGRSKLRFPYSLHNRLPSAAIDAAPYPIRWPDQDTINDLRADPDGWAEVQALARFYYFGGYVLGTADTLGVPLVWGGDWAGSTRDLDPQSFDDLVHFQEREDDDNG